MSTTLYNNACAPAQAKAKVNPAMTNRSPENRLVLLSEHSTLVYKRCLDKLALCQISLRCLRVFYIVLNQTVGSSKREDNINSMRLEKLTDIRHDHAAQAMKDLVAMNIIIHRTGGKYRNWLSINFNFEMWGNLSIAEHYKSNNPELLLPKKYTETPIDNGLVLDPNKLQNIPPSCTETTTPSALESTEDIACNTATETHNITAASAENTENSQARETDHKNNTIDSQAVQKLETKLTTLFSKKLSSALETINQTLQGFEKCLSTTGSTQTPVVVAKESIPVSAPVPATKRLNTPQKIAPIPAQNQACQNEIQTHKNNSQNNTKNKDQEKQDVVVSSDKYVIKIAPFNYPEALNTEQCQALQGLLIKSGDRAQDLLMLLAQRLKNTHNPVVDPASYFASLVYKYQNNTLDFSALNTIKVPKSKKEKAQQEQFKELKFNHRTCYNDYLHFQKLIEAEMKKSQQSFKQVCENNPLGGIIENCSDKLIQAKQALDDFLAGDDRIPS